MPATDESRALALVAASAAADKKARNLALIDVSEQLVITDCFVIASAPNERQVQAIADNVEEKLREAGTKPVRREGAREGRWVLLDFVDIVVHIQHAEEHSFYGLERLWKDCPRIPFDGGESMGDADDDSDADIDADTGVESAGLNANSAHSVLDEHADELDAARDGSA